MSERVKKWSRGPWVHKEWGNLILSGHKGAEQISVAHVSTNTYRDECRYNAYLIKSAPALVEALEDMLADYRDACEEWDSENQEQGLEIIEKAESALSLAYGETQ